MHLPLNLRVKNNKLFLMNLLHLLSICHQFLVIIWQNHSLIFQLLYFSLPAPIVWDTKQNIIFLSYAKIKSKGCFLKGGHHLVSKSIVLCQYLKWMLLFQNIFWWPNLCLTFSATRLWKHWNRMNMAAEHCWEIRKYLGKPLSKIFTSLVWWCSSCQS